VEASVSARQYASFRAENSNTSRHLAEFWMIEPEIAFADLSDNASLAKALLKYTLAALLKERGRPRLL
jgi:asparaginyl-tRNA synthetase